MHKAKGQASFDVVVRVTDSCNNRMDAQPDQRKQLMDFFRLLILASLCLSHTFASATQTRIQASTARAPAAAVAASKGTVLHEGWYTMTLGGQKIGYFVERYEFTGDSKFKGVYFLKTNAIGGNITESLKALSKSDLTPLSYAYTTKSDSETKVIDASFKGETMTLNSVLNGAKSKAAKKVKKGTFLSTFLLYLILQQKNGLKIGKDYAYSAIAEEDGSINTGSAYVKSLDKVDGQEAFKILNEFKGKKFFSWVTPKGSIAMTRFPENNIEVKMASSKEAATKGFSVNEADIKLLFGQVPGSTEAPPIAAAAAAAAPPSSAAESSTEVNLKSGTSSDEKTLQEEKEKTLRKKSSGPTGIKGDKVEPGKGIQIKGVQPPTSGNPAAPAASP